LLFRLLVDLPRSFGRHFRAYRKYTGNHMFALTGLNFVMSWAEGLGLALFFPLLRGAQGGEQDSLSSSFNSILSALGVDPTPTAVLPLIVAVFVFKGLLMQATYSYQAYLAAQIPLRLRREIVGGLRRVDYRTIDGTNTGFVSNLLVNEVYKVSSGFISFVRTFPPTLNILVFFTMVLWLDWRLTLLCGVMALIAIMIVGITGRIAMLASRTLTRESAKLSSLLIQLVQAFKYLRATAGFGTFESKIGDSAQRMAKAEYKSGAVGALSQSLAQPLMVVFLAGIIYYQVAVQNQPLGSLFVLLLYFFRIMTELWMLQSSWQTFMGYSGSIDIVYATADKYHAEVEATGTKPFEPLSSEIALSGVSFSYIPGTEVLRDVDLKIPRNSTVAFVGESGSGKSTLVDLIVGTLKPSAGTITYDNTPLRELELESLRRNVGYVPQDAMLFDDTVGNNISLWKPAEDAKILDAAKRAKALEFIEAMPQGLASEIGDRGFKLSGGQRQRIAIARELFKQPSILVLDEATSALDTESERAIQHSVDSLKGQMTILIIAHRLSTIRNCERVCVLHGGKIVEMGSYDELLARPGSRFQRLCQLQELTREIAAPAAG
jgi:ABC-type multidrug transport system fused ATPase/permease subunit